MGDWRGRLFQMGCDMQRNNESKVEMRQRVLDLQNQVDELKDLVNTLLSVIVEEPDGVHTGAAPSIPGHPHSNYCM
ncbi:MAG: hypothetical protein OSB30_06220 [Candidatus Poseidoniaceae archaeon]|nr:hypothetical protein [Candidatus Poseidoniaceae archaeon]